MKRYPKRAVHDKATIHAILDEVVSALCWLYASLLEP